jgi:hypothetical protein
MADGKCCEVLTVPVFNGELVGKSNICECCSIMRTQLHELKSELNSCREIIKILQEEVWRQEERKRGGENFHCLSLFGFGFCSGKCDFYLFLLIMYTPVRGFLVLRPP